MMDFGALCMSLYYEGRHVLLVGSGSVLHQPHGSPPTALPWEIEPEPSSSMSLLDGSRVIDIFDFVTRNVDLYSLLRADILDDPDVRSLYIQIQVGGMPHVGVYVAASSSSMVAFTFRPHLRAYIDSSPSYLPIMASSSFVRWLLDSADSLMSLQTLRPAFYYYRRCQWAALTRWTFASLTWPAMTSFIFTKLLYRYRMWRLFRPLLHRTTVHSSASTST